MSARSAMFLSRGYVTRVSARDTRHAFAIVPVQPDRHVKSAGNVVHIDQKMQIYFEFKMRMSIGQKQGK
jgi:hypothetical protein